MAKILSPIALLVMLAIACGSPKTATEVTAPFDETVAKEKFGNDFEQEDLKQLMQAETSKQSGDQLFAESESLLNQAKETEQAAEKARSFNEKKRMLSRAEKMNNQAYDSRIAASAKYGTANQANYELYRKMAKKYAKPGTEKYIVAAADEAEESARTHYNLAAKKRSEAQAETDKKKKAQLLAEASELEFLAVDEAQRCMKIYKGEEKIKKPQEEIAQNTTEQQQPQTNSKSEVRISYKVQIAASRNELPLEHLHSIYQTRPGEIINNELEDSWYKYSVGSFDTYAEAQAYKDEINVKGAFIIAYREDQKIVLPEIQEKISRGEISEPIVQSDIIYKLQIAATKIPARPSQLANMYHGKQTVSINKLNGWYKYTVGNFDTREKAEAFKNEDSLHDAFVVAFDKDGYEVPLK